MNEWNPNGYTWRDHFGGVYAIQCDVNKGLYIGSSVDIRNRLSSHLNDLKAGRHHCEPLQRDFDRFGFETFQISVIEFADSLERIRQREQYYLDITWSQGLYNIAQNVEHYDGSRRKRGGSLLSPLGEIVNFTGIAGFCREHGLTRMHVAKLLSDTTITHKGWRNLAYENPFDYECRFISPKGAPTNVALRDLDQFCSKHGLKRHGMQALLVGRQASHAQWTAAPGAHRQRSFACLRNLSSTIR